ncbi:MAG: hypothetical protein K1X86_16800 [Ignavibacteria bacterium]|nr:hypothetical protein [Ignavibacteria bacterium]
MKKLKLTIKLFQIDESIGVRVSKPENVSYEEFKEAHTNFLKTIIYSGRLKHKWNKKTNTEEFSAVELNNLK